MILKLVGHEKPNLGWIEETKDSPKANIYGIWKYLWHMKIFVVKWIAIWRWWDIDDILIIIQYSNHFHVENYFFNHFNHFTALRNLRNMILYVT